jgi:peptide/nickel transport system substrate-binding protein
MNAGWFANFHMKFLVGMVGLLAVAAVFGQSNAVRIVLAIPVNSVDACDMSRGYVGTVLKQNVIETLTQLQPSDSAILPRLALGWERRDPYTWRITLRQGVRFHDGSSFNAAAVVAALKRIGNPGLSCADRRKFLPGITLQAKAVDDYTVDITSDERLALMPAYLAQLGMTSPKTDPHRLTDHPVGTGPYRFGAWDPDKELVLQRFDGYWGKTPAVQKATYVWRPDSAARAAMVQRGEADVALQIAIQDATHPKTDLRYFSSDTTRVRIIMQPPLDDIRVRKAINLAFNRDALIGTVFSPNVLKATQQMLPSINGHNPDLKVWPFDVEKAKQLIKDAGASGAPIGNEIILYGRRNMYANSEASMQAMVQMWRQIGLNIRVKMLDSPAWLKIANKPYPNERPAMLMQDMHDNAFGDAAFTMMFYYTSAGSKSDLTDPIVDALLAEASAAIGDERRSLFQAANKYIQENVVPDVMMYHMINVIRIGERLRYQPDSMTNGKLELSEIAFNE